jgi:hypothetical protein
MHSAIVRQSARHEGQNNAVLTRLFARLARASEDHDSRAGSSGRKVARDIGPDEIATAAAA